MDELDEADKLFGKHTVEDAKKAEVLLDELRKNQYLQPACIRMGTIYSFINGD